MGIVLDSISKSSHGYKTLRDLSLSIDDGTFLAVVAPTGTGKTTLLRVMAGLEKPDKGRILVDGRDVTDIHVRNRNVAMVYQDFINYPTLTVYENIASPLRVNGSYSGPEIDKRVRTVAEQLQIAEFLKRTPHELSGGQQQRVAIARALVKESRLILLDEPLGNLDYKLREDLRIELKNIAAGRSLIFVYATPEPIDALTMASHTAILHGGRIIQFGETIEVYNKPNHIRSGEYFSDPPMNFLPARLEDGGAVVTPDFVIPSSALGAGLAHGQYSLGIRAHHIDVREDIGAETSDRVWIEATVELAEIVGSDTTMHLVHDDLRLIALSQDFRSFELNQRVYISFDPGQIHIFDAASGHVIRSAAKAG